MQSVNQPINPLIGLFVGFQRQLEQLEKEMLIDNNSCNNNNGFDDNDKKSYSATE